MQFKVPQNIDMEDKIIGPLTMKQFVYLIVGGMITYATIKTYNVWLIVVVGLPIGLFALCLAFIKIQDQSFSKFLFSLALFQTRSKKRLWSKTWEIENAPKQVVQKLIVKEEIKELPKHVERSELEKLSYVLDTRGEESIAKIQEEKGIKINNKISKS